MAITPDEADQLSAQMEDDITAAEKLWDQYIRVMWDGNTPLTLELDGGMHVRARQVFVNKYQLAGWDVTAKGETSDKRCFKFELKRKPHDDIREGYRGRELN